MRGTVLVVDDNREIVEMLAVVLNDDGYEVLRGYDGLVAIRQAIDLQPDAIVLDVGMPVLGGLEASCRLRALPETRDIPILLINSVPDVDRRQAMADDLIDKPFDIDDLLDRVAALVQRHQRGH
ncbi:MAG: response regulator [Chloroflexi bacterium]|nr:response regulator [Chloroflexota bacterium]